MLRVRAWILSFTRLPTRCRTVDNSSIARSCDNGKTVEDGGDRKRNTGVVKKYTTSFVLVARIPTGKNPRTQSSRRCAVDAQRRTETKVRGRYSRGETIVSPGVCTRCVRARESECAATRTRCA